jgi:hypothetical protein
LKTAAGFRDAARRYIDPLGNIVSRRMREQLKASAGKKAIVTLEQRAKKNPLRRTEAQRAAYALRRREAAEKKVVYKGEKAKDIAQFEKSKATFLANPERESGHFKRGEYQRMQEFAYKHRDVDSDFVSKLYPPRMATRRRRGRVDPKGRPYRQPQQRTRRAA